MFRKQSSEVLHKNPWWEYKHDTFLFPDGKVGDYYYAETPGVVVMIPVTDDNRLVLVREYRYLMDRTSIEFPGGGIKKDETVGQAAQRELQEEIGYSSNELIKIVAFEPSNGFIKDTTHVFIATNLMLLEQKSVDETEAIEVIYRRPDEFDEMVKNGEIWDGQTLAAWAVVRDRLL